MEFVQKPLLRPQSHEEDDDDDDAFKVCVEFQTRSEYTHYAREIGNGAHMTWEDHIRAARQ
jgi:hypothetical protein